MAKFSMVVSHDRLVEEVALMNVIFASKLMDCSMILRHCEHLFI